MEPSKSKLLVRLESIYSLAVWSFSHKAALVTLLVLFHQSRKSNSRSKTSDEARQVSAKLMELIAFVGCTSRGLGVSAAMLYCLYPSTTYTYALLNRLWRRRLASFETTGSISFLKDCDRECKQLRQRIISCALKFRASNFTHRNLIAEQVLKLNLGSSDGGAIKVARCRVGRQRPLFARVLNDNLASLKRQDQHLSRLTCDQSAVRPATRNHRRHKIIVGIWFLAYMGGSISYTILSFLLTTLVLAKSRAAIDKESEPKLRQFTPMEKLDIIMQQLFLSYTMDWFIGPSSFMVAGFVDQLTNLSETKRRFSRFNQKLAHLIEYLSSFEQGGQSSARRNKVITRIRYKCDNEALEIYISIKVLMEDIRIFLRQAEYSVIMASGTILTSMFTMLSFVPEPETGKYWLIGVVGSCLALNLIMLSSAFLNKQCMNTVQLGWSLIGNAERFASLNPGPGCISGEPSIWPLGLQSSNYILTPHTVTMWRRLLVDHNGLANLLSRKLLGVARLNFSSILQLNFCLASLIALLTSTNGFH